MGRIFLLLLGLQQKRILISKPKNSGDDVPIKTRGIQLVTMKGRSNKKSAYAYDLRGKFSDSIISGNSS